MDNAGRNRWRRTAAVAVMGVCAILGGWVGLSRSAAPDSSSATAQVVPLESVQSSPVAATPAEPAAVPPPAIPVLNALPEPVTAPPPLAIPAIPTAPPLPATTPPVLPPIPAADVAPATPPALPPLPNSENPVAAAPKSESPNLSIPPIAPVVPVLAPPLIETSVAQAVEIAPSPSPSEVPVLPQPILPMNPDSRLQGGNPGNSVKSGDQGQSSGLGNAATEPPALPALPAVPPVANGVNPIPAPPSLVPPGEVSGTTVENAKPIDLPLPSTEKFEFVIPRQPATTSGDTNVSIVNKTAAAAVLGGLLCAPLSPAEAATPLSPLPIPARIAAQDKTDLAALKTEVAAANTKLNEIQTTLKTLTEILKGKKDEKGFTLESDPGLVADMKKMKDTLAELEKELNKVKTQSSSLRPPTGGTSTEPKLAKGIVRIVNEYPVQISIVVNGTSYRVLSRKSVDVDVPAGDFTYQLLESGAAPTRSIIKDKETVTLRIK